MTITEARKIVGQKLGFGSDFSGGPAAYAALSQSDQVKLNAAVMEYIRQNPSLFTADQVAQARAFKGDGKVVDSSFDWSLFGEEVLNNARDINPLDPKNIGKVGLYLLGAAVVVGVAYVYFNRKTK